jgi:hypothetical protein
MTGLEKPCSYEKGDARDGDQLFERPRRRDGDDVGGVGRGRFLIAGQAEDGQQRQARDGTDQTHVSDEVDSHRGIVNIAP